MINPEEKNLATGAKLKKPAPRAFSAPASAATQALPLSVSSKGLPGLIPRLWRNPAGYYALVGLFFLGLVVIYTWPATIYPDRVLPGYYPTDQDQNIWSLWWLKRSLLELHTNPFQTNYLFYPYGTSLYLHALAPLLGLLVLPWNILAGPVEAYNAAALLGLTATALTGAALGRVVSGNRWGGLIAGYLIAFGPIHFSYIVLGQLEFINLWPFLLYLVFLVKLTDLSSVYPKAQARWWVAGATAAMLMAGLVTLYYVAYGALFTALYLVLRGLEERKWAWWRITLSRVALVWLIFALGFGYLAWQVWQAEHSGSSKLEVKPIIVVNESVAIQSYFTQLDGNVLLGKLLGLGRTYYLNRVHYLGFGVLFLAGLGLGVRRRGWFWLGLSLFFAIASFGPTIRTDPNVNPEIGPLEWWLPWNWLQKIPLLDISHSPTRLALLALIAVAMLAAQGGAILADWSQKLYRQGYKLGWQIVPVSLGLVLLLEGPALPVLSRTVEIPPQVAVIQADCVQIHCGDAAVLDLPFTLAHYTGDHDLMFFSAMRQKPVMGGYLSREIPNPYVSRESPFHIFIRPTSQDEDILRPTLSQSVVTLLNIYNIRYITVDQRDFQQTYGVDPAAFTAYLIRLFGSDTRLYKAKQLEIYRVPPPIPNEQQPLLILTDGWRGLEQDADGTPKRWIGGNASMLIYSFEDTTTTLSFEAVAFNRLRHMPITLNGEPVANLEIKPTGFNSFRLEGLKLKRGENVLVLDPVEQAESPAEIDPSSKDVRNLSVALRRFQLGQ